MAKKEQIDRKQYIDDEQLTNRQLEKQIEELHKANEEGIRLKNVEKFTAVSRMARTVAHEIRNPLTNISLAIEQLNAELPRNDDTTLLIEMINRNTMRINTLISDLLNSTKFAQLDFSDVFIHELLGEVIEGAIHFAEQKNVHIEEHLVPNLPRLMADADKLKTAFENLLINAIESVHSNEGKIVITTASENNKCVVTIHNNGAAISDEKLERLFEPYFTSKGSSGLALTHAQNIILNHGGSIYVESEHNKGTTFTVILEFA